MENKRKERIDRGIKVRTEGIYSISSIKDMIYIAGPRIIFIAALLLLPIVLEFAPYWKRVSNIMFIYFLLAMSFDFLANYVGLVCLGCSFFIGIGGYTTALLNSYLHIPVLVSIPVSAILGAILCTFLFLPCLKLKGVYFAIVTLMYPLLFTRVIEALNILGGTNGITGLDSIPGDFTENYLIIIIAIITIFALRRFVEEDIGLVMRGVKDNDQSIRASGINVTWMKVQAVFIASLIGCFGGAYLAHLYSWAGISLFALDFSIIPIAAVTIGGSGMILGAIAGCIILVPLSEFLRVFGSFRIVLYCTFLTLFIIFKSEGIMSYLSRKYHQFERWVDV